MLYASISFEIALSIVSSRIYNKKSAITGSKVEHKTKVIIEQCVFGTEKSNQFQETWLGIMWATLNIEHRKYFMLNILLHVNKIKTKKWADVIQECSLYSSGIISLDDIIRWMYLLLLKDPLIWLYRQHLMQYICIRTSEHPDEMQSNRILENTMNHFPKYDEPKWNDFHPKIEELIQKLIQTLVRMLNNNVNDMLKCSMFNILICRLKEFLWMFVLNLSSMHTAFDCVYIEMNTRDWGLK